METTFIFQLALNGLVAGVVLALPAIGFTLIFGVTRWLNFSFAAHVAIGAYAGYVISVHATSSVPVILIGSFLVAGTVGALTYHFILRQFAQAGPLVAAIASVALHLVLENALRFIFGNDLKSFDLPIMRNVQVGGLSISPQQVENGVLAAIVLAMILLFMRLTRAGKAMRAVADDPVLADIKGINPLKVAALALFVGMGLAGTGGALIGIDTAIEPIMGFKIILSIFAAAVVGGLGNILGAALGAIAIGMAEELSLLVAPPAYRSAIGFLVIFVVLTLRPAGLLGRKAN